jgi:uncharacterized protein (DUF305 family)
MMKLTAPLLAAAGAMLLVACGSGSDAPDNAAAADHAMMDHSGHDMGAGAKTDLTEAQAAYKAVNDRMHEGMADIPADADVAFMQGMLAHHKGAVEMSEVALKYAKDDQARDLAGRVIAAQKAEIAEMETWLKARAAQ